MQYIEGIERQVQILEEAQENYYSNPMIYPTNTLWACANCYELEKDCKCNERTLWPINFVLVKLRWMLYRRMVV